MKVYYKTDLKPRDTRYWQDVQVGPDFCCDGMKHAWDEGVRFGGADPDDHGIIAKVCIASCHPYPEGAAWHSYEIDFCPFCGEKIETIETKRIRYVARTETKTQEVTVYDRVEEKVPEMEKK